MRKYQYDTKTNINGQDKVNENLQRVKQQAGNLKRIRRLIHHQGISEMKTKRKF